MYLGLDVGTSGVKALLIDASQAVVAEAHAPLEVSRPQPGWSEQNPEDWIAACQFAIAQIRADAPKAWAALKGIGLSGQMHGATLLDADNKPLRPAILWNDGRASRECAELEARADFRGIAGNLVMAGFTAPKLLWVARHEPEIFAQTRKVLLPKDYVSLWLTGDYVSDLSDASGTLWLDVGARAWAPDLLTATGLTMDAMPRLVEGVDPAGTLRPALAQEWGVENVIVAGGAGDNAATACGLGLTEPGDGFLSLGTSGVLFSVTDGFAPDTRHALHAFCHALPDRWHQMAVILSAADSLSWFAAITGKSPAELIAELPDEIHRPASVRFLPYLSGERTPLNDPDIRASFENIGRDATRADLTQAILEGVAFAFAECRAVMEKSGTPLSRVWLAGGGSRAEIWLRILASATGLTLLRPASGENGAAKGAARLAIAADGSEAWHSVFAKPVLAEEITPAAELAEAYRAQA